MFIMEIPSMVISEHQINTEVQCGVILTRDAFHLDCFVEILQNITEL